MHLTHFGGVALPDSNQETSLVAEGRSALVELANGAFDQDGASLVWRPTTLSCSFILAGSGIDATLDALAQCLAGGRRVLKARADDGSYRQTFAKLLSLDRAGGVVSPTFRRVSLRFAIPDPFWFASADEPRYLDNGETLDAGWNLDGNYTSLTLLTPLAEFTIAQSGTVVARRGQITVTVSSGGSLQSLIIENRTTGEIIYVSGSINGGSALVVDLAAKSVLLDGAAAYDRLSIGEGQMDWLTLQPGDNVIRVTCGAVSGTVTLVWQWAKTYV
jgi:hypothetical protein